MPAIVRLTKKELSDLIERTEAAGCDVACLRGLLAEVEEEERRRQPARRVGRREPQPRAMVEEMTAEDHIEALRQQSTIEHGTDLECMICHDKFDHLISGTCEGCFSEWMLGTKRS